MLWMFMTLTPVGMTWDRVSTERVYLDKEEGTC